MSIEKRGFEPTLPVELEEDSPYQKRQEFEESVRSNELLTTREQRRFLEELHTKVVGNNEISRLGDLNTEPTEELGGKSEVQLAQLYIDFFQPKLMESITNTLPPRNAILLLRNLYNKGFLTKEGMTNTYGQIMIDRAKEANDSSLVDSVNAFLHHDVDDRHVTIKEQEAQHGF